MKKMMLGKIVKKKVPYYLHYRSPEGDFDKHVRLFIVVILPHSLYTCIFAFIQILLIIIEPNK